MSELPERFRAFVVDRDEDAGVRRGVVELASGDLDEGDLVVAVEWSSLNYKDHLATTAEGRVARKHPLIAGIDLAGTVVSGPLAAGTPVVATGHGLGVSHHGGLAELCRMPAAWARPLPEGLSPRDAMAFGTAGLTAAASIDALETGGLQPGDGPVLVTGASGGVGSLAVAMLAARGHQVVAATGTDAARALLLELGAEETISREEAIGDPSRPLAKERWAGVVDTVGGAPLAGAIRAARYGATVTACGNTAGAGLELSIFPFILRGVTLAGIDSVELADADRDRLWSRMAGDLRPAQLERLVTEVELDAVDTALAHLASGDVIGRTVVAVRAADR